MRQPDPPENYTQVRYRTAPDRTGAKTFHAEPPEKRPVPRTAVLVAHGMGQQVPFETIDGLARRLRDSPEDAVQVGFLTGEGDPLPRAELTVGGQPVDIYEVYWAPVTQGKVLLKDVVNFLLGAAWRGLVNTGSRGGFERWMFGRWQMLPLNVGTTRFLFTVATAVFLSLLLINAVAGAAAAVSIFGAPQPPNWLSGPLKAALTGSLLVAVLGGLLAAGGLALGRSAGGAGGRVLMRGAAYSGLGAVILSGLLTLCIILLRMPAPGWASFLAWEPGQWVVWTGVAILGMGARWFILEFVGDVTAYVSAHTVNRYAEIRREIQEIARKTGKAVYGARDGERWRYSRVLVVGHSLGSVVAYDLLNALLREDLLGQAELEVRDRTPLFLTFGSPLNKTAYVFRTQQPRAAEIREALAAAIQPMITSYAQRPDAWINIWSPDDWISGPLRYYDSSAAAGTAEEEALRQARKVENLEDPEATVPGAAHNQYWANPLLRTILRDAIADPEFRPDRYRSRKK